MPAPVKFRRPPVVEVACGVAFNTNVTLKAAHVGHFWHRIRDRFPNLNEGPPLSNVFEIVGTHTASEFAPGNLEFPLPRTLFASEDGRYIIQVQQDRFVFNWKRSADEDSYPSYKVVIADFEKWFAMFRDFVRTEELGEPVYRQYELSYVNHIRCHAGLEDVFRHALLVDHVQDTSRARFLPEPEMYNWATSYRLPEDAGRLHVGTYPAILGDERIVRLDITARGIPQDPSERSRRPWFDLAHEWITHGFADVTSPTYQKTVWDRQS